MRPYVCLIKPETYRGLYTTILAHELQPILYRWVWLSGAEQAWQVRGSRFDPQHAECKVHFCVLYQQ